MVQLTNGRPGRPQPSELVLAAAIALPKGARMPGLHHLIETIGSPQEPGICQVLHGQE
ncbi:MAG: hypothetical protein ACRDYB_09500 [Acidimicrobiales bacterium]